MIPTDKYISIKDEARADELRREYGNVVTTDEKFYFNPEVLERNKEAIENLIQNSQAISEADKENLVVREVKYSITKGMIDKLYSFGSKMENVMDAIQPIFMLKNCGGGKEKSEGGALKDELILDTPVITGYSECHYAPVYGSSDICSECGEHCKVLMEAEMRDRLLAEEEGSEENEQLHEAREYGQGGGVHVKVSGVGPEILKAIANSRNKRAHEWNVKKAEKYLAYCKKTWGDGPETAYAQSELDKVKNEPITELRHGGTPEKEFELSLGDNVYWGNYHYEGNELFMDTCETMDEEGNTKDVEDNDTRLKVYRALDDKTSDEALNSSKHMEMIQYAKGGEFGGIPANKGDIVRIKNPK